MKGITTDYIPHLIIVAMMAATSFAISLTGDVAIVENDIINRSLPASIGDYEGVNVLFCQNESCLKSYTEPNLNGSNVCPECGGGLMPMGLAEISSFPADTTLSRKLYETIDGYQLLVTEVVTGKHRTGIHRPQYCLPAQNQNILNHRVFSVPVSDGRTIDINILDLQEASSGNSMFNRQSTSAFAYFYVGRRTTPSYLGMIFWMSYDLLVSGESRPWAYISITTARQPNSEEHVKQIVDFVSLLCQEMDIRPDNSSRTKLTPLVD